MPCVETIKGQKEKEGTQQDPKTLYNNHAKPIAISNITFNCQRKTKLTISTQPGKESLQIQEEIFLERENKWKDSQKRLEGLLYVKMCKPTGVM
jgi:hypothetical protein